MRKKLFHFIVECVVKTYGQSKITKWVEKHPGKTVLDMITVSDIAYSVVVIDNSSKVWEQQEHIKTLDDEEQEKFKNPKLLPARERAEYAKVLPKYTQRKGKKAGYLASGWNNDGRLKYKDVKKNWDMLYEIDDWLELWREDWENFCAETKLCSYWVRKVGATSAGDVGKDGEVEIEEEICDDNEFFAETGDDNGGGDNNSIPKDNTDDSSDDELLTGGDRGFPGDGDESCDDSSSSYGDENDYGRRVKARYMNRLDSV